MALAAEQALPRIRRIRNRDGEKEVPVKVMFGALSPRQRMLLAGFLASSILYFYAAVGLQAQNAPTPSAAPTATGLALTAQPRPEAVRATPSTSRARQCDRR